MRRKKVSPTSKEVLEPDPPAEVMPETVVEQAPIKKHHRVVTTYEETVQPGQSQASPRTINISAREVPEDEEEVDPIEELLNQIELEKEQGYVLRIDRLPQYRRTGMAGRGAPKEFQTEMPFSLNYLSDIQALFGPGDYLVTLKDGNHRFINRWVEHIGAPALAGGGTAPAAPAPQVMNPHQANIPPTVAAPNPLESLANMAKQLKTIRESMGWDQQPPVPQPAAQVLSPEKSPEERQLELILALVGKNESVADRVLQKFFGEPAKEPGILEFIAELATPLVPLIAQAIIRAQQTPANPMGYPSSPNTQLPPSMPQAQMPVGNPTSPSLAPEPLADLPSSDEEQYQDDTYMDLLDKLVASMSQLAIQQATEIAIRAEAERGAGWVREFQKEHPGWAMLIKGLIHGTPDEVLQTLESFSSDYSGVSQNPVARVFIEELQKNLRG